MSAETPNHKDLNHLQYQASRLITVLEQALADGHREIVEAHLQELQDMIDALQKRIYDLSLLQYRACLLRDSLQHGGTDPDGERQPRSR